MPNFKQTAGRFAQALATYHASSTLPVAAPHPDFIGSLEGLRTAAAPLHAAEVWSRADVEFVQYGGLTPVSPRATFGVAFVILQQNLHSRNGAVSSVRRALDLRLRQREGLWRIEQLATAGGQPIPRPAGLSALATKVLDHLRIDLPDTARWDIHSGQISDDVMAALLQLADVTPLRVTVLKTGHPERVVDGRSAPPVSAHWLGRAVDINALDGVAVAEADPALVRRVVEVAGSLPTVVQVGAPPGYDFDAGSSRWFTNLVHADHLHVAVRRRAAA